MKLIDSSSWIEALRIDGIPVVRQQALFILGLDAGVAGAALATVIAQTVELLALAWPVRRRLRALRASRAAARAVLRQGLPTGVQFVVEVGAFLSLTAIVARMSSADCSST